jgi:hypothetical protein
MKASSQWIRRAFLWSATGATTAAMIVSGSSAEAAHTTAHAGPGQSRMGPNQKGPGYPPPMGIYRPFTNCPLLRPLMQESVGGSATGCIAGYVRTGSIKIGKITTKVNFTKRVSHPVIVQFGVWDPANATPNQFTGGILPPSNGLSAQLVSVPEYVPGGLLRALGCPNSNRTVQKLCAEAKQRGGKYLQVHAVAQSAGLITNFNLTTWTQPLKFNLINPLLGSSCYIGSSDNPVVLNPSLSGTLVQENDPQPKQHPNTAVLKVEGATATDTTFTAPGVTGCGPGGSANIAIDEAIDTSVGLPSVAGADALTLNGTFYFAACFAPHNMANILLSAFKASAMTSVSQAAGHRITIASLRDGRYGIRKQR